MAKTAATTRNKSTAKPPAKTQAVAAPAPRTTAKAKSAASAPPAAGKAGRKAAPTPPPVAKPAAPTTVTLRHLSAALAQRHALPKKQADAILTDVFGSLVDHLKAGERVRIGGLGVIEVKNRPARMGHNPATGQSIQIAASKKVAFRAAKELKDAI